MLHHSFMKCDRCGKQHNVGADSECADLLLEEVTQLREDLRLSEMERLELGDTGRRKCDRRWQTSYPADKADERRKDERRET